jgi:hypothetical protein
MTKRWNGKYGIESPFTKRMGPDGKEHEGWCPIFLHECCVCRDRYRGKTRYVIRDAGGASVKKEEKELA